MPLALTVRCHTCRALPGESCTTFSSRPRRPHPWREYDAQQRVATGAPSIH